jgi:hypothetical protein
VRVAVNPSPMKVLFLTLASKALLPLMMPWMWPSSWRITVSRSYLPVAGLLVAWYAVEVSCLSNSLLSPGVVSMNQPWLLPLMSRVRVPELGRPFMS